MSEARSQLEEALEYLINEDQEKAVEAFHKFVVQKARAIHEELTEDDEVDEELDETLELEEKTEEAEEDVNEAKAEVDEDEKEEVDESDEEKEEVDENIADARQEIRSDEYFGRDELTAEDDDADDAEMELGDDNGPEDNGEVMPGDDAEGEVELDAEQVMDIKDQLEALTAKFQELVGGDEGVGDEMGMDDEGMPGDDEMADEEPAEEGFMETKDGDAGNVNKKQGAVASQGQYSSTPMKVNEDDDESEEVDESEDKDKEEVDEAVTHDPGVQKDHKTDPHGNHGSRDNIKHNDDAKLPESTEFDFDLTEEDFLELEEGLKQVDVKMGGEQGGVKFAGEETQTKSPVAQKDKSDIPADPKDLQSKQKEHGTYDLEQAPSTGNLPHSGDNSHESADGTGSPNRSEVSKGGGLDKQKGYGEGEAGAGSFAGTEKNVTSPIGSKGTRYED